MEQAVDEYRRQLTVSDEAVGAFLLFEAIMSLIFLVDVVLSFRTAYFFEGKWVTAPGAITRCYLRGWFWIDAPSSVPVELLEIAVHTDTASLGMLRFLRMFRLVRLLRLLRCEPECALRPSAAASAAVATTRWAG